MSDEYDDDEKKDGFLESDVHVLGELELEPWTPSRATAADVMGLKWPHIAPADRERFDQTSLYPGALNDVAIILWLCSLKDDPADTKNGQTAKEKVRRARRRPQEAEEMAIEWAAAQGFTLDTKSEKWWDAYNKALSIVIEARAARTEPKETGGGTMEGPSDPK